MTATELNLIGSRIKALRKEKGMSQIDLATTLRITQSTVSNIERGRTLEVDDLTRIADLFEVTIDYLVKGGLRTPVTNPTQDEAKILAAFRDLDSDNKNSLLLIAENALLAQSHKAASTHSRPAKRKRV